MNLYKFNLVNKNVVGITAGLMSFIRIYKYCSYRLWNTQKTQFQSNENNIVFSRNLIEHNN